MTAVDKVTDNNLINFTKNMPVIVAIRSRADETLEWMATKLGITWKPVTIKQKNVDLIDETFLEYRKGVGYGDELGRGGGDRGSVVLAEPIPPEVVQQKLVGASKELREEVITRYRLRWEEWYGKGSLPEDPKLLPFDRTMREGSKSKELKDWASNVVIGDGKTTRTTGHGTIKVPKAGSVPEPSINDDVSEIFDGANFEERRLELRQVIEPPGNEHFGGRQREYYEVWIEDNPLGVGDNRRGTLRRVGGDVDTVITADVSGYKLGRSPRLNSLAEKRGIYAYGNLVAETLQRIMKAQHPWSSSLRRRLADGTLDEGIENMRAKFLKDHVWRKDPKLRGEPLIIYINGERRVAWFNPSKNIDPDNPLASLVFLDGAPASVDEVVRSQWDARNLLPTPEEVAPNFIRTSFSAVKAAIINNDYLDKTTLLATCAVTTTRASGAAIYRLGQLDQLEKREADGSWTPAAPETECGPEGILVAPEAILSEGVVAGVLELPIIEQLLGPNLKDFFQIGDDIVIAPGTPEEELNTIANHGSLILARPLRFSHPAGTVIALLAPALNAAPAVKPTLWLKSDSGLELDDVNVVTWRDQSSGSLFVNPEGGRDGLPVIVDSGLGMPAVRFKGDEWISGGIDRRLTNATIFTLARFNVTNSSGADYLYSIGSPGVAGSMMTLARRNGDDAYHWDGKAAHSPPATVLPGNSWQVLTQVYGEEDPSNQRLSLNGELLFDSKSAAPYNVDARRIYLGNYESGRFFLDGDIVEWLLFDRVLPAAERAQIEAYLKKRGGLHRPAALSAELSLGIVPAAAGRWILSWEARAGQQYQLERSDTLLPASWTIEKTITVNSQGVTSIEIDSSSSPLPRVFYRLHQN